MNFLKYIQSSHIFILGLLILFCSAVYHPLLHHSFMLDDYAFTHPQATASAFSTWLEYFQKSINRHYEPIYNLLNVFLFGYFKNPLPLYFINIVLVAFSSWLHFILIIRLTGRRELALLTAVIFMIHPMNAENIQHITFNVAFLSVIFLQLGLISIDTFINDARLSYQFCLSLICFASALLCHEIAMLFPFYLLALLWFRSSSLKKSFQILFPFICISMIHLIIWFHFAGSNAHLGDNFQVFQSDFSLYTAHLAQLIFWYVKHLILPDGIVFIYSVPMTYQLVLGWNILFWATLIILNFFVFFVLNKRIESFALLIFMTGFFICLPASSSRPWLGMIIEPYWFYFSSIGFYFLLALFFLRIERYAHRIISILLITIVVLYFNFYSQKTNLIAREELLYCEQWLKNSPNNVLPIIRLAKYYADSEAIEIPTEFIRQFIVKIDIYLKLTPPEEAEKIIRRLLAYPLDTIDRQMLITKLSDLSKNHP